MRHIMILALACGTLFGIGGCPPEDYPDLLSVTLTDIDEILNDDTLSAQEQRLALADLGLSSQTINVLLKDKSLANQGGGDLRTAYYKLVAPNFLALTPDEIQIYATTATSLDEDLDLGLDFDYNLTDEEGLAIAEFFADYDIDTPDELETILDDSPEVVPATIPDDALQDLFIDFDLSLLLTELP